MQPMGDSDEPFDAAEVRAPRVPIEDQSPHPADHFRYWIGCADGRCADQRTGN